MQPSPILYSNVKMVKTAYNVEKLQNLHAVNLANTVLKIEVPKTRVSNNETGSSFQFSVIVDENNKESNPGTQRHQESKHTLDTVRSQKDQLGSYIANKNNLHS